MLRIITEGISLDLPEKFSMEIEETSPVYNDIGSQSLPATVALTRSNIRALGAPYRIDSSTDPNYPAMRAEVIDGVYRRTGTLNVTEAGRKEGITFNIGFDNSEAYSKWRSREMKDLKGLPVNRTNTTPEGWASDFSRIYEDPADPEHAIFSEFSVFPIAVGISAVGNEENAKEYWEVLNNPNGNDGFTQPRTVKRVIDGELKEVNVPPGYGLTVFLKVWRVLELVFKDLGLTVATNPFKDDIELSRLVILNNAVDAVCSGAIDYKHLMPDCKVEEFLNALYVRFGMVYLTDFDSGTVDIHLLRDILEDDASIDITSMMAAPERIEFPEKQYLTLSAATSIDGAKPATDRFEDFAAGADLSRIGRGTNISNWRNTGTSSSPKWDGDLGEGIYDEDYDPDRDPGEWEPPSGWDDDRDDWWDDRDYDMYADRPAISRASAYSDDPDSDAPSLARECVSGQWYKLDGRNGRVKEKSSSFFKWDPQTPGMTPMALSSIDECVPVMSADTKGQTGWMYLDYCPAYLFGARHFHTYIKESGEDGDTGDTTPLAFMFAYTSGRKTCGRLNGELPNGKKILLDDGTRPGLSLLFQFRDGLFNKFWSKYDEILRHGNQKVNVETRIPKNLRTGMTAFRPIMLRGVKCLLDSASYSLPARKDIDMSVKLRTIMTQGEYDIEKEQNVPQLECGGSVL